jgi:hypothetical protein
MQHIRGGWAYLFTAAVVNWLSQVRNASTGTSASTYTTNTTVTNAFLVAYDTNRTNKTGQCARVPLFFDVSSITASNTITAATLKVWNPMQDRQQTV